MAVSLLELFLPKQRSLSGPVTGTGAIDAFGRFTIAAGGVRQKLSAICRVAPGARVCIPSSNFDQFGRLLDDDDTVSEHPP